MNSRQLFLFSYFLIIAAPSNSSAQPAIDRCNVVWDAPSQDSYGSMPLGNGDIGLNAWIEKDGDLLFYISKTDAWSENGRLLKLGRVRIQFTPNPFRSGQPFQQTLSLADASILVKAGESGDEWSLKLWIDANAPVIHVEADSQKPILAQAALECWRTEPRELEKTKEIFSAYGLQGAPFPVVVSPDVIHQDRPNQIAWHHFNKTSIWMETLKLQGLPSFAEKAADPLLHRAFGGVILGKDMMSAGAVALRSRQPHTQHEITIIIPPVQTGLDAWAHSLDEAILNAQKTPLAEARARHEAWWKEFWNRSWIYVNDNAGDHSKTFQVTQGYALQRFITACAGRGSSPIKFNGSIFTVDCKEPGETFDADYRRWGGPYWFQNTRLIYWPLLAGGDFDMAPPLFDMYFNALPLAKARTQIYFQHEGAYFPETMYFWGAYANENFGWDRQGKSVSEVDNHYIRYYWSNNLELLALMLEYYEYTKDGDFLHSRLLPMADEILFYFDKHFPRTPEGKIRFEPSQALETWQKAVDDAPDIAGMRRVLEKLLAFVPAEDQRQAWKRLLQETPEMPLGSESGKQYILPAAQFDEYSNSENPELYPIFPYRLFGVGKPGLEIGRLTFEKRLVKRTGGWTQDPIQAAYLGLTKIAQDYMTANFMTKNEKSRFPAFWGPNFDWIPDQDHGNAAMLALQAMLMQCDGGKILLFPAWPKEWDVEFKLHAPMNTVVECVYRNGKVERLAVTPPERTQNVVIKQ
ncbi:MAG: DUF5703 domain-containing protein [Candidatus Omnitrophota bacterium]